MADHIKRRDEPERGGVLQSPHAVISRSRSF